MTRHTLITLLLVAIIASVAQALPSPDGGRSASKHQPDATPTLHRRLHVAGNLYTKISNDARIGQPGGLNPSDPETAVVGHDAQFEFPAGSRNDYLFNGSLWVGGIVGNDTLVSEGVDGASNDAREYNAFTLIDDHYDLVTGRQTYTANYFDTLVLPSTSDEIAPRLHLPLGLSVTQKSHVFATHPYDAFVLVEYTIRNISSNLISDAYVGIVADADVWPQTGSFGGSGGPTDDLAGYLSEDCVAYAMDNDGDPGFLPETTWVANSLPGAFAIAPVDFVPEPTDTSFNWWATNFGYLNWGPSQESSPVGTVGIPFGDAYRYEIMSNRERDYDQLWSAMDMTSAGWRPGDAIPQFQSDLANGQDTRFLLSFGAFDLEPGDSIRAVFVLAAGDFIHTAPTDYANNFVETDPSQYYGTLDFSDLSENVRRARQVHELGFQLPGAPPTQLTATPASMNKVQCSWSRAPFEGVSGYRLYRRVVGHQFEFINSPSETDTTYVDWNLTIGSTYEYAITSLDADGNESAMSMIASATPGKPTEIPMIAAKSIRGIINVELSTPYAPTTHSPIEYINLFRRAENSTDLQLIHRVAVPHLSYSPGSLAKRDIGQVESARARDDRGPRDPSLDLPSPFIDSDVESGKRYFYSATVTNGLEIEGERSEEAAALSMGMERKGLILFHTVAGSDRLINADSLRNFYWPWASKRAFDTISVGVAYPLEINESVTSLVELSRYPVIILVIENDSPRFPYPWSATTGLYRWLDAYSKAGGRLIVVARHAESGTTAEHIMRDFAGAGNGVRERWVVPHSGGVANWETYIRFERAVSIVPKYPSLDGDSARAWNFPFIANMIAQIAHDYVGGNVPAVGFLDDLYPGTEVLYTFRSDQPDTSVLEGRVVGVRRLTDSTGGVIMFAFPLSLMKYDQAWNALSIAVDDLGADTSWTSLEPDVDLSSLILQWLYQPTTSTPNPAWDTNRDGVIDILDVVETLQRR